MSSFQTAVERSHSLLENNLHAVEASTEPFELDVIDAKTVVTGLNAFYYSRPGGGYIRPNLADRTLELSRMTERSEVENGEYNALKSLESTRAVETLYSNGHSNGNYFKNSPTSTRSELLSVMGFGRHRLAIEAGKVATGLARLHAEAEPSVASWMTALRESLATNVALHQAEVSAFAAMESETDFQKFVRCIGWYARGGSKGELISMSYVEHRGEGHWWQPDTNIVPFIVEHMQDAHETVSA